MPGPRHTHPYTPGGPRGWHSLPPLSPQVCALGASKGQLSRRTSTPGSPEAEPPDRTRRSSCGAWTLRDECGGGKTTICHLIPRFYFLEEGHIYIDNIDISDYTLRSLREKIGIVQQDVFLFGGTIKDNILYGKPSATDEEIMEAARRANILDFINSLPNGWDSQIGERGVRLSGGQKQRLSIARLFLKNPPILILDEATSALDNTTEMLIQKSLRELAKGRTCLIVAHRLSTIKNADEIAVVSKGKIMEKGTHDELMKLNGIYSDLYRLQFKNSDDEFTANIDIN